MTVNEFNKLGYNETENEGQSMRLLDSIPVVNEDVPKFVSLMGLRVRKTIENGTVIFMGYVVVKNNDHYVRSKYSSITRLTHLDAVTDAAYLREDMILGYA